MVRAGGGLGSSRDSNDSSSSNVQQQPLSNSQALSQFSQSSSFEQSQSQSYFAAPQSQSHSTGWNGALMTLQRAAPAASPTTNFNGNIKPTNSSSSSVIGLSTSSMMASHLKRETNEEATANSSIIHELKERIRMLEQTVAQHHQQQQHESAKVLEQFRSAVVAQSDRQHETFRSAMRELLEEFSEKLDAKLATQAERTISSLVDAAQRHSTADIENWNMIWNERAISETTELLHKTIVPSICSQITSELRRSLQAATGTSSNSGDVLGHQEYDDKAEDEVDFDRWWDSDLVGKTEQHHRSPLPPVVDLRNDANKAVDKSAAAVNEKKRRQDAANADAKSRSSAQSNSGNKKERKAVNERM
jgi:hypothetical protein